MASMDNLNESARLFKEKKTNCINFLAKAVTLAQKYEEAFPPPKAEGENGKTRTEIFENIEKKLENDKLKILVAGQFKQGKSTLINALLGEEILPAFSTPCTAVITEIAFDENKKAIISFKEKISSIPKELSQKAKNHIGNKRENIPDLIIESEDLGEELEEFLVIPEDEDKEQRESVAESPYARCLLKWPLELCRNEVEIIDSPGLNEATARDATTYEYVPKADMILHVLNANQFFGKPDKEFIDKTQGAGGRTIIFIVNRFDQLNTDKDRERVRNRALKELCDYTEHGQTGIFFTSSFKALTGRQENNPQLYEESGFPKFEKKMADIIARDRTKIKLGGGVNAALTELGIIVNEYLPQLREKLNQNVSELEKKYSDAQIEFRKLEDKKERIERIIEKTMGSIQKMLKSELRIFFRDFASDSITCYTDSCQIKINLWNKKESTEGAVQDLTEAVFDGMQSEIKTFLKNKQQDIQDNLEEMKQLITEQLNDFNDILASIRAEMNMNEADIDVDNINVAGGDLSDTLGEAFAGALVGGVAGAGAIWAAGQFFALLAGPVGWGIAIATALGSALLALLGSTSAEDKVKEQFVKEAARRIRQDSDQWAEQLSSEMAKGIEETKKNTIEILNRKITETKNPILAAIELLKQDQGSLEEKKKELEIYRKEFKNLYDEGKQIQASL